MSVGLAFSAGGTLTDPSVPEGVDGVWVVSEEGRAERVVAGVPFAAAGLATHPSEAEVVVTLARPDAGQFDLVRLCGPDLSQVHLVHRGCAAYTLQYTPDGDRVVFTDFFDDSVYVVGRDGCGLQRLSGEPLGLVGPSATAIAAVDAQAEPVVLLVDVAADDCIATLVGLDSGMRHPLGPVRTANGALAGDASHAAVDEMVFDLRAGSMTMVTPAPRWGRRGPDGSLTATTPTTAAVWDHPTGSLRPLPTGQVHHLPLAHPALAWAPSGQHCAYVRADRRAVVMLEPASRSERVVVESSGLDDVVVLGWPVR